MKVKLGEEEFLLENVQTRKVMKTVKVKRH